MAPSDPSLRAAVIVSEIVAYLALGGAMINAAATESVARAIVFGFLLISLQLGLLRRGM